MFHSSYGTYCKAIKFMSCFEDEKTCAKPSNYEIHEKNVPQKICMYTVFPLKTLAAHFEKLAAKEKIQKEHVTINACS